MNYIKRNQKALGIEKPVYSIYPVNVVANGDADKSRMTVQDAVQTQKKRGIIGSDVYAIDPLLRKMIGAFKAGNPTIFDRFKLNMNPSGLDECATQFTQAGT